MKNLREYINESSKIEHYEINKELSISMSKNDDFIKFDKSVMKKLLNKNEYTTNEFIKSVFDIFKEAEILWIEEIEFDGNYDPIQYVERNKQNNGWQDEQEFENYPNPFRN